MTDIKSIPSMTKAELVKEVERLVALVRSQSAAMTELGKLSDMQQGRIDGTFGHEQMLRDPLKTFLGRYLQLSDFKVGSGVDSEDELVKQARAALGATEPRP